MLQASQHHVFAVCVFVLAGYKLHSSIRKSCSERAADTRLRLARTAVVKHDPVELTVHHPTRVRNVGQGHVSGMTTINVRELVPLGWLPRFHSFGAVSPYVIDGHIGLQLTHRFETRRCIGAEVDVHYRRTLNLRTGAEHAVHRMPGVESDLEDGISPAREGREMIHLARVCTPF